jgi:hypothetical protein
MSEYRPIEIAMHQFDVVVDRAMHLIDGRPVDARCRHEPEIRFRLSGRCRRRLVSADDLPQDGFDKSYRVAAVAQDCSSRVGRRRRAPREPRCDRSERNRSQLHGLDILHFPIRSKAQFENIIRGGAAYARKKKLPSVFGGGWRSLYATYASEGSLDTYLERQRFTPDQISAGLASGALKIDPRLAEFDFSAASYRI